MPTTIVAAIIVAVLFLPGYLTLLLFNRRQAWAPKVDLSLFAQALAVSAICHLPFFWVVPHLLRWNRDHAFVQAHPLWSLFLWFLAVALLMPAILGVPAAQFLEPPRGRFADWVARTLGLDRIGRATTAWDAVWGARQGRWVVVKLQDGEFVAGKFGQQSAVAFWKDGRDIYLEEEWTVDAQGRFSSTSSRVPSSQGVWIDGSTIASVRFAG